MLLLTVLMFAGVKKWSSASCARVAADRSMCTRRRRYDNFAVYCHQNTLRGDLSIVVLFIVHHWAGNDKQGIAQWNDVFINGSSMGISMVQLPSKCFWSSTGHFRYDHADQWVRLLAWGFLLEFYSNCSPKMHCCWATGMEQTDRQTDGSSITYCPLP